MTATSICTNCGLCCDGTLFNYAALDNAELFKGLLDKEGITAYLKKYDLDNQFYQPCPFFNGQCGIYLERPTICRKFKCSGLKSWENSEISYEDLTVIIEQIKHFKNEVMARAREISRYENCTISEMRLECQPIIKDSIKAYPDLILKIGLLIHANSKLHIPKSNKFKKK